MTKKNLYSIRMRASSGPFHISGAERIVAEDVIERTAQELAARALSKATLPERIVISLDRIDPGSVRPMVSLDLTTLRVVDADEGGRAAIRILEMAGVSMRAAESAIRHIQNGAAPSGGNMRGAMIIDSVTGERLEDDRERGVRVTRFDWTDEAAVKINKTLADIGLTHFRTREALALATKVSRAPGIAAELCWSDDPDYTAGYVASPATGYVRFPFLKKRGDDKGGRALFVRREGFDMDTFIRYIERDAVLITEIGKRFQEMGPEIYFRSRE